jgi:hypothetical protein
MHDGGRTMLGFKPIAGKTLPCSNSDKLKEKSVSTRPTGSSTGLVMGCSRVADHI